MRGNQPVFYENRVVDYAHNLKPSPRDELEISNLNRMHKEAATPFVEQMCRGYAWLDTGTHDSLLEASKFVSTFQHQQAIQIACLEEIAFKQDFVSTNQARGRGEIFKNTAYG